MNEIIMAEWFNEHWYKITKKSVDHFIASVTTKLSVENKPNLSKWRGDIGNREADTRMYEASERGKRIHAALHIYLLGGAVIYNPWNRPVYTEDQIKKIADESNGLFIVLKDQGEMLDVWKLQRFFEIVKPEILHSELIVYSIDRNIAGTLDIALKIEQGSYPVNGSKDLIIPETGIYIADLKTGKTVEDSVWRQIAPYASCFEEMGLGDVAGGLILHTGATTKTGIKGFSVKLATRDELDPYLDDYFSLAHIWERNNKNAAPEIFSFPTLIRK